jgi:hypothetical protein
MDDYSANWQVEGPHLPGQPAGDYTCGFRLRLGSRLAGGSPDTKIARIAFFANGVNQNERGITRREFDLANGDYIYHTVHGTKPSSNGRIECKLMRWNGASWNGPSNNTEKLYMHKVMITHENGGGGDYSCSDDGDTLTKGNQCNKNSCEALIVHNSDHSVSSVTGKTDDVRVIGCDDFKPGGCYSTAPSAPGKIPDSYLGTAESPDETISFRLQYRTCGGIWGRLGAVSSNPNRTDYYFSNNKIGQKHTALKIPDLVSVEKIRVFRVDPNNDNRGCLFKTSENATLDDFGSTKSFASDCAGDKMKNDLKAAYVDNNATSISRQECGTDGKFSGRVCQGDLVRYARKRSTGTNYNDIVHVPDNHYHSTFVPKHLIDGVNTSMFHTIEGQPNPYVNVDLKRQHWVTEVKLINRSEAGYPNLEQRLKSARIYYSNSEDCLTRGFGTQNGWTEIGQISNAGAEVTMTINKLARCIQLSQREHVDDIINVMDIKIYGK